MKGLIKFLRTIRAVLWSFLGIRKGAGFQEDIAAITPLHLIGVGIALCFLFVLGLMFLVQWMVKI
ncbi:MAG: DUF2970 domain-containing protein [Cytophagales bacterium]|nr:DUF2970 domain-containing protein [Cytophagales bacterium]